MEKYHCILESFKIGKLIDDEVYNIVKSSKIDEIISLKNNEENMRRIRSLGATGLSEDQEIKLHTAYLMCVLDSCNPKIFSELYKETKKWYETIKEQKKNE